MTLLAALLGRDVHHFSQAFPGAKDTTSEAMRTAIGDWFDLYYAVNVPDGEDPCQRIPCAVVSKLQKACFSEYEAVVKLGAGGKRDFMAECQKGLDAVREKAVQLAMIGGEAWVKPVPGKDGFAFTIVRRDSVAVLGRDGERVTDIISAELTEAGNGVYTLLERRTVTDGYLTIRNKLFYTQSKGTLGAPVPLSSLTKYQQLLPEYTFEKPVGNIGMASLRMPVENTVDGSLDAVSVYASADRLIHNINHNEWLLNQEFDHGAIRVIASEDMMLKGPDGRSKLPPGLYAGIPGDPEDVGVTVFSPALRDDSFLARKTEYLRNVESLIGIKRGLLSEVEAVERTAKEITSSEGDYNLTVESLWRMWEKADREALALCDILGQLYDLCDNGAFDVDKDVAISWGDGVLYDRDKVWQELRQMVADGMLRAERALGWYFDVPCDTDADMASIRRDYMPQMEALLETVEG